MTMFSVADDIIGLPVVCSIAEPWDFESEDGDNRLTGHITAISDMKGDYQWCICTCSRFVVGKVAINSICIVDRYQHSQSLISRLTGGEIVNANFLYSSDGRELSVDAIVEAIKTKRGLSFLAGSVRIKRSG